MGYYFHPDLGLVMAGGDSDGDETDSVERTEDGQNFLPMPSIPEPKARGCMVITEDGVIYLMGGRIAGEKLDNELRESREVVEDEHY